MGWTQGWLPGGRSTSLASPGAAPVSRPRATLRPGRRSSRVGADPAQPDLRLC